MSIRGQIEQLFRIQPKQKREVDTQSSANQINRKQFLKILGLGAGVSLGSKLFGKRGELYEPKPKDTAAAEHIRRKNEESLIILRILKDEALFPECSRLIFWIQDELQSENERSRSIDILKQPDGSYVGIDHDSEPALFSLNHHPEIWKNTREQSEPIAGNYAQLIEKLLTFFVAQPTRLHTLKFGADFSQAQLQSQIGTSLESVRKAMVDEIAASLNLSVLDFNSTLDGFRIFVSATNEPCFSVRYPFETIGAHIPPELGTDGLLSITGPHTKKDDPRLRYDVSVGSSVLRTVYFPPSPDGESPAVQAYFQKLIEIKEKLESLCEPWNQKFASEVTKVK